MDRRVHRQYECNVQQNGIQENNVETISLARQVHKEPSFKHQLGGGGARSKLKQAYRESEKEKRN